jgi:signal-transduction protein with cAMP-binding, CBS, and nucleotidyltransferase domain
MKIKVYKDIIIDEGEFFDRIYFIIKGKVECVQNDIVKNNFSENQYFGEVGLFIDFMTNWRYQANGEVILYELYNYQVPEILGKEYLNVIMENLFRLTISKCENLKSYLTAESIIALYNIFRLEFYFSNKIVFRKEKEINKKISIMISGKLVKDNDKNTILAKSEDIYGEEIIDFKEK